LFYKLKRSKIEPLSLVKNYLDNNISFFNKNINIKNEKVEKFQNIYSIISNLEKVYKPERVKEEKNIRNEDTINNKPTSNYRRRNTNKKDNWNK